MTTLTSVRDVVARATVCVVALLAGACSGGNMSQNPPAPPTITSQPAAQSVPMGLAAAYSVGAGGASLQYQWMRDGAMIPGATGSTYVTPPTQFADTGAVFAVTVSNPGGVVKSSEATLTVTARAPRPGDLRFQQVDASWTVTGYGANAGGVFINVLPTTGFTFSPAIGTPLSMGSGVCAVPPVTDGEGCSWYFGELPASGSGVAVGYTGGRYADFPQDIVGVSTLPPANGLTPDSPNSVVTSLDLEPSSLVYGVSWLEETSDGGFDPAVHTVAPTALQAAATAEGAGSRVITALSHDTGGISYISYGWQGDRTTVYEASVVIGPASAAPAAAATLAGAGYIITAAGLADDNGNIVLVGTRVQGDTLPRAFVATQGTVQLGQQGYAPVALLLNLAQDTDWPYTFLGER